MSWGSDFWTYWTYSRNSMTSWVQWLQRHIQSEKLFRPSAITPTVIKWGGQSDIPFTHTTGVSKSMWVLPLLKLRSRYETDWIIDISCEGTSPSSCWKYLTTPVQLWWQLKSYGHTVLAGATFVPSPLHQSKGIPLRSVLPLSRRHINWLPRSFGVSFYLDKRIPSKMLKS